MSKKNTLTHQEKPCIRAFRVEVKEWADATTIVRTISPERAKFLVWNSCQDAGYNLPFGRFRVLRAPVHDQDESLSPGRCYSLEFVGKLYL